MRKILYKFLSWVMHYGSESKPEAVVRNNPFEAHRHNQSRVFTVVQAENGTVLQTYDYNRDGVKFWVVPDGKSIGNMVDVVLIAEKLK